MVAIRSEDNKKWINAFIAIVSIIVGFVFIRFMGQMGEWFDLESKIRYYLVLTQVSGALIGLVTFIVIQKRKDAMTYLNEVYGELVKVVWPGSDSVVKLTVGIIIGLSITSLIFVLVDFAFRKILALIY
ncbi:MAG: preprotein translocase subunit SecE [Bacteriovoracaceae bacterium]|nr:preprotein translocase subunit SecE [Bacteriovoracaceae bacterium]